MTTLSGFSTGDPEMPDHCSSCGGHAEGMEDHLHDCYDVAAAVAVRALSRRLGPCGEGLSDPQADSLREVIAAMVRMVKAERLEELEAERLEELEAERLEELEAERLEET